MSEFISDISASFSPPSPSLVPQSSKHHTQPPPIEYNHYTNYRTAHPRPYTAQSFTQNGAFHSAGNRNPSTRRLFSAYSYMEHSRKPPATIQQVSDNRLGLTSLRARTVAHPNCTNSVPTANERMDHTKEFEWMPSPMVEQEWRNVYRSPHKPDPQFTAKSQSHKRAQPDNESTAAFSVKYSSSESNGHKRRVSSTSSNNPPTHVAANRVSHHRAWLGAGANKKLAQTDTPVYPHPADPFDPAEKARRNTQNHSLRTGHRVECDHGHLMKLGAVHTKLPVNGYHANRLSPDGRWTIQPSHNDQIQY